MITTTSTPNIVTNPHEDKQVNTLMKESLDKNIKNLNIKPEKVKVKRNPFLQCNGGKVTKVK